VIQDRAADDAAADDQNAGVGFHGRGSPRLRDSPGKRSASEVGASTGIGVGGAPSGVVWRVPTCGRGVKMLILLWILKMG
jgi:hypothetical protein